jgi:dienelactone hydrolase
MNRFFPALVLVWLSSARAEVMTAARVDELRGQIRAHFFVPESLPALEARTYRYFSPAPGVRAEAVTYATEFGTRIPAILYLPDPQPAGRIPGFIVVTGHGGDKYSWYSYYSGITYARAGAAVLTYDQAGEGERSSTRTSGTREHDRLVGDTAMARRLAGLMITDVMQGVSYLQSRPEVDSARIGAGGYSLGSFVLSLAGAVEPRLRVCVLVGGGNLDGPGGYWDASSKNMCQAWPYQSLNFLGDRGAVIYALHAVRGPTLIWNGSVDAVVSTQKKADPFFADLHARTVALHGSSEAVFEWGFTPEAGHRPHFLNRACALWLEQKLDFPNWTEASIKALPETHISEWSKQFGIPIDPALATEEREGGTLAVGRGVPGFERETLSVFTPEQWENEKGKLMFSAWTEKAKAASKASAAPAR